MGSFKRKYSPFQTQPISVQYWYDTLIFINVWSSLHAWFRLCNTEK